MGGSPNMPEMKMPPPPPPPAPMDTPEIAQAELDMATAEPSEQMTGSKRKYRKRNVGKGKSGGHSSYKGGGLNRV